jgi:N6-adenosine-specific RNA methylase IME4
MTELRNHPAADAFPMMDEKRAEELAHDIADNGLRIPIVLCDGMILDGRNRYRACVARGITPTFVTFDGNPWEHAWTLNGIRRDLVDEQRYLIWKYLHEQSEAMQAEVRRIAAQANAARRAAAQDQPRKPDGTMAEKPVVGHSVLPPERKAEPRKEAKAQAAKVNAGAVARGDRLAAQRPDLAEKVRMGEVKPAEAHREMKRDAVVASLEDVRARRVKEAQGVYDVIVIDPPWPMEKIERDERPNQVAFDYPTMSETELADLEIPAADDAHVWVWTTHKHLPMALRLLDAWALKYVCTFVWHKPGGFQPIGLPQYNCEFALYARRGAPQFIDTKALPVCFDAPRTGHSVKPDAFYDTLRRVTAGRRLDMFNRRSIDGFDGWGNEAAA